MAKREQMHKHLNNEDGFVMVVALMILVILTLIGTAGLETSTFEEQIAGNDWMAKQTFYKADGSTELGAELLEYNFSCGDVTQAKVKRLRVNTASLFKNDITQWQTAHPNPADYPSIALRDLCWPSGDADQENPTLTQCDAGQFERVNIKMFGKIGYNPGSAIQMAAGYEGKGKGAAGGGAAYTHEIHSQNQGVRGNEAVIRIEWMHLVGQEDPTGCYNHI